MNKKEIAAQSRQWLINSLLEGALFIEISIQKKKY